MEKQIEAEMLEIIEKSREEWSHDVTDHTENEYIREGLLNEGYRKQSDTAKEIFAEIDGLMLDGEIGGKYPAKVISPQKYADLKKKYTEANNAESN